MNIMEVRYDTEADAIYIYFSDKSYAFGRELDNERRIDYAADNTLIGIELLDVSDTVNLTGLPYSSEIANALASKGIECYYGFTKKADDNWIDYSRIITITSERNPEYNAVIYIDKEPIWEIPKEIRTLTPSCSWGKREVTV